jgi:hypothetical protein
LRGLRVQKTEDRGQITEEGLKKAQRIKHLVVLLSSVLCPLSSVTNTCRKVNGVGKLNSLKKVLDLTGLLFFFDIHQPQIIKNIF